MSLIGDALRKARQEAAERDSDRRGILFSAKIADSPGRSNLGLGLALGALIAIVATVAGGFAVWWALDGRTTPGTADTIVSQGAAEQPIDPEQPAPASVAASVSASGSAPESVAVAETDSGGDSVAAAEAESVSETEAETETGSVTAPDPVVSAGGGTSRPSEAAAERDGLAAGFTGIEDGEEIYILEADLGDVRLSLDFLVFRAEDPFAEINGVEIHLGGTIEGYRVKSIERDRVRLSDGRRTIVLRAP